MPQSARKACLLSPAHSSGGRRRDPVSRRQGRTPQPLLGRSGSTRGGVGRGGGAARLPGNHQARLNGQGLRQLAPLFGAIRHYSVESVPFQHWRCRHGNL